MFIIISGSFIEKFLFCYALTKLIVCLTGMPGAGKSTIADGLKPKGYDIINMGNAVREEAKKEIWNQLDQILENLCLSLEKKMGLVQ